MCVRVSLSRSFSGKILLENFFDFITTKISNKNFWSMKFLVQWRLENEAHKYEILSHGTSDSAQFVGVRR